MTYIENSGTPTPLTDQGASFDPALDPAMLSGMPSEVIPAPAPSVVEETVENTVAEVRRIKRFAQLGFAALKAAVRDVAMYIPEAAGSFREVTKNSIHAFKTINNPGAPEHYRAHKHKKESDSKFAQMRKHLGLFAITGYSFSALLGYQLFDDVPMYWAYTHMQDQIGTAPAYVAITLATGGVAIGLGMVQRGVEKHRAYLMGKKAVDDDSNHHRHQQDAYIMSAPWQVFKKANTQPTKEERERGEHVIQLMPKKRIIQQGLGYMAMNPLLYYVSEKLPGNDWVGLGITLLAWTAICGAYNEVKSQLKRPKTTSETTEEMELAA